MRGVFFQRYIEVKLLVNDGSGNPIEGANITSTSFPAGSLMVTSQSDGTYTIQNWFVAGDIFLVDIIPGDDLTSIIEQPVTVGQNSPHLQTFMTQVHILNQLKKDLQADVLFQANQNIIITCTDDLGISLNDASVTSDYFTGGQTSTSSSCSEPCFEINNYAFNDLVTFNCSLDGYVSASNEIIPISSSIQSYSITVELKVAPQLVVLVCIYVIKNLNLFFSSTLRWS